MVAGLPLTCIKGGALGYKSTGRSRIYDSITTINTINYPHVYMLRLLNLDSLDLAVGLRTARSVARGLQVGLTGRH
jgi:hypothetical protein